jgi:hypothetical protein
MQEEKRRTAIEDHIRNDAFARFLGAEVTVVAPGHSRVSLTVTEQMTNFHGITHGGVVFALGDMAFAAARQFPGAGGRGPEREYPFSQPVPGRGPPGGRSQGVPPERPDGALRDHSHQRRQPARSSPAVRIWCIAKSSGLQAKRNRGCSTMVVASGPLQYV